MIILLKFPGTPQSFGCATENFIYKGSNRKQQCCIKYQKSIYSPIIINENQSTASTRGKASYLGIASLIPIFNRLVYINSPRTLINVAGWLLYLGYIFEKIFR